MRGQRWLRSVRIVIAMIFLAGFILIFSDVKGKLPGFSYEALTSFQFIPSLLKFLVLPGILTAGFILIVMLTIFSGRVYCSALCPLGILQDAISFIRVRMPFKAKRRKFKKALNYIRYPILGLSVLSLFFTGILAFNWLDPYANFGRIASNFFQPAYIAIRNLLAKFLVQFIIID